jgi:hypothetical protein
MGDRLTSDSEYWRNCARLLGLGAKALGKVAPAIISED